MNVGQLAVYDQAKEASCKFFDENPKTPSLKTKLSCAALSGFSASTPSAHTGKKTEAFSTTLHERACL